MWPVALSMLGADVRPVPAVAFSDPMNYNHQAKRFAESLQNAVWTNQVGGRLGSDAWRGGGAPPLTIWLAWAV
jgi:hypothetical protein